MSAHLIGAGAHQSVEAPPTLRLAQHCSSYSRNSAVDCRWVQFSCCFSVFFVSEEYNEFSITPYTRNI